MLDIQDLERRWFRYKIKSYTPYGIVTFTLIVITILVVLLNTTQEKKSESVLQQKKKIQTDIIPPKKPKKRVVKITHVKRTQVKIIQPKKTHKEQLLLKPSLNFIHSLEHEEDEFYNRDFYEKKSQKTQTFKRERKVVKPTVIKEKYMDIRPIKKPQKEKHLISIERKNSENDIKEVLRRFKENNNPALSLFVAKKYYELGNYKQAYNYALITNDINHDIEASWLIFTKSLVKLNKKELAIKTLQKYINYSHSGNAKILLNEIQTGKFQ